MASSATRDYYPIAAPPIAVDNKISPIDAALLAVSGSRVYQRLLEAVLGVALFGGSVLVWVVPMLFDTHIATDMGLSSASLVATSCLIYFGWIGGCFVLSPAGDRHGRKSVLVVSGLLAALGAFMTAAASLNLSPTLCLVQLAAARLLGGFALGGLMSQALALVLEANESARTTAKGLLLNVYYCGAVCLLAAYHYLARAVQLSWPAEIAG